VNIILAHRTFFKFGHIDNIRFHIKSARDTPPPFFTILQKQQNSNKKAAKEIDRSKSHTHP